jgi:hypothetical protein
MKQFLSKHMKSDNVKVSKEINEKIWGRGIKNPPHKVKITATKDSEGKVTAELFGAKKVPPKADTKKKADTPKAEEKKETPKSEEKPKASEEKQEQEALKKVEPKEEKLPKEHDDKATQSVPNTENQKF